MSYTMARSRKKPDESAAPEVDFDALEMDSAEWQEEFYRRKRLEKARIPQRYRGKTLDTFAARDKLRKHLVLDAEAYIKSFNFSDTAAMPFPKGLMMQGSVGCGKTHLAVAILREIIAKGYTGLYYNSPDLFRDIRASFDPHTPITEDDILEEVTATDLLVFDDVGAEKSSEFVLDRFYLIINERYNGGKPVIITTNLDDELLESRMGRRIVSRLCEMCEQFGPYPDEDWRKRSMR